MSLTRVTALEQASIDDLNQIIDLLEGTSGFDTAFLLRCLAGSDFKIRLADAAGARRFEIQDSAGVAQAYIDSDGNLTVLGSFTPGSLILPGATSPSLTTNNQVAVDTDDVNLKVRIGGTDRSFYPGKAGWQFAGSNTQEATMTSSTAADMVTVTGLSIPATAPVMIVTSFRKSANAFQPVIGLKVNSTTVVEASAGGTAAGIGAFASTNEAQDGISVITLGPRRTNYDHGLAGYYATSGATGSSILTRPAGFLTAAIPIATITDIIIRGDSDGTNTLGVHGVYVYQGAES